MIPQSYPLYVVREHSAGWAQIHAVVGWEPAIGDDGRKPGEGRMYDPVLIPINDVEGFVCAFQDVGNSRAMEHVGYYPTLAEAQEIVEARKKP